MSNTQAVDTEIHIRTVEEAYVSATHASNLRVEAERKSSADILIAAGWSRSRLGLAVLRLHSEWDASEHLEHLDITDLYLLAFKLKSLPAVRGQLEFLADKWGIEKPRDVAAGVLMWWLSHRCPTCGGTGFDVRGMNCKTCKGTGETKIPFGDAGRKMAGYIDECIYAARGSIKRRLRNGN